MGEGGGWKGSGCMLTSPLNQMTFIVGFLDQTEIGRAETNLRKSVKADQAKHAYFTQSTKDVKIPQARNTHEKNKCAIKQAHLCN